VPGHGASPEHLARHNRPRTLYLILDRTHRYRVTLPQDPGAPGRAPGAAWWVVLPQPVASRCLTVVLGEVYAGSEHQPPKRHGDTALSEVTAFTDLDFGDATRRVLDEVARGGLDREQAVALLERLGLPELARLRAALRQATLAEREVVLRVLGKLDPVGSVAELVAALPEAEAPLRTTILQAVRQAGAAATPLLTRLLGEGRLAEAALTEVVAALADAGGASAVTWLIGQVGVVRPALRAVIIDRLGSVPEAAVQPALLASLADTGLTAAVRADLLHVAFLRVPRASPALREALTQRLMAGWDADPGFAVRYRQVALAGALGGAPMVGRLTALVGSPADPLLRAAAVRAAAQIPLEDARVLVRRATQDRAPDVRVAAVVAWVQGLRDAAGARSVAGLALGDPWPMVREQAVLALGQTCHAEGHAALLKVAATLAEWRLDGIRRAALLNAVRCQVPGAVPVIRELLVREKERVLVRSLAARMSGELRLGSTAPYMIRFLDVLSEKVDRVGSRNELLAADLAVALGQLGDRAAVPVLLRAAAAEKLPNLQSAALDALGRYCPPAAAALVRASERSSNRAVSGAAQRTRSRCRFAR
jgi:HEAT repeat protein